MEGGGANFFTVGVVLESSCSELLGVGSEESVKKHASRLHEY